MGKYFKTDGFRGRAGVELNSQVCYKIGRFLGERFKGGRIAVGKDTRLSSYMIEYSLVSGMISAGGNCALMHVCTTPCMSYIARVDGFSCAVMISASHNSYEDNGIKLFDGNGEKMDDSFLAELEEYIDTPTAYVDCVDGNLGRVEDYYHGRNRYISFLTTLSDQSLNGYKIGLDTANGSTYMIAKCAFSALGASVYAINDQPDGLNVNRDCGALSVGRLREFVLENSLDMGFAFDGDGDRCIAVDEKGEEVDGDKILYVLAKSLKEEGRLKSDKVVGTVMTNLGLEIALEKLGITLLRSSVGDRKVYELMESEGCVLGGESSGHTIIRLFENTGDGIATAITLARICVKSKAPLSLLVKPISLYPKALVNIPYIGDSSLDADGLNGHYSRKYPKMKVLIRRSGTEKVIRLLVEGESEFEVNSVAEQIYKEIKENV